MIAPRGIAYRKGKGHIITSSIEHHAVMRACDVLEKDGFTVTYLSVPHTSCIGFASFEADVVCDWSGDEDS